VTQDNTSGDRFTCDVCGRVYPKAWSDQESAAEAAAVFDPAELADAGTVCDPCWQRMRASMPDFDARYVT
jgi:hypothetical protein